MIKYLLQDVNAFSIFVFTLLKHHLNSGYNLIFCYFLTTFFQVSILRVLLYNHLSYFTYLNIFFSKGITKSMQTQAYFAFWLQNLENIYSIILIPIILFQYWTFFFICSFLFFIERWVTWMTYYLADLLLTFDCLFDLILYVPSTIFQLKRDGYSWVEPVLS